MNESIRNLSQAERERVTRRAIHLHDVDKMAARTIARRLGVHQSLVQSMLHGRTCAGLKSKRSDGARMRVADWRLV